MLSARQQHALSHGTHPDGRPLTTHEREKLLEQFLPETPSTASSPSTSSIPSPVQSRSTSRLRQTQTHPSPSKMAQPTKPRRARVSRVERRKPIRNTIWHSIYVGVYWMIHFFFSIYIRLRKSSRAIRHRVNAIKLHHSKSPELIRSDVKNLNKMPKHLSVILELPKDDDKRSGLNRLLQDVGELTAWCASVGIPLLSVYEKTGIFIASPYLFNN
jgi:dehydrodolichyl diphosphate syntase complex subunit NUS1